MIDRDRRRVLGGAAGALALTAGCIADLNSDEPAESGDGGNSTDEGDGSSDDGSDAEDGDSGSDTEDDDGEDVGDDETGDADDPFASEGISGEIVSFQHSDVPETPSADFYVSAEDARRWLDERDVSEARREELDAFVGDTDFETSRLVSLWGDAPDLCHEMVVEEVTLEDGTIGVSAAVSDESADDEMCAQQLTGVAALVRATVEGEPPNELSATITGHDGTGHGVGVGTASESTSGSENESDADDADDDTAADEEA